MTSTDNSEQPASTPEGTATQDADVRSDLSVPAGTGNAAENPGRLQGSAHGGHDAPDASRVPAPGDWEHCERLRSGPLFKPHQAACKTRPARPQGAVAAAPEDDLNKLPPHDSEAEAGLLGSIVLSEEPGQAAARLRETVLSNFYDHRHRTIFRALQALEIEGKELNMGELALWLRRQNQMQEAGGGMYVLSLPDAGLSTASYPMWRASVDEYSERRRVLYDTTLLASWAADTSISRAALLGAARRFGEMHQESPLQMRDAAEFLRTEMAPPVELIHGLLHRGSKLVLGGGSKSFKTWTLLDLAVSVSHGLPWLGFPTTQGRVLYVNFEIQSWSWWQRIKAVVAAKGVELQPEMLMLLDRRGQSCDYSTLLPSIRHLVKKGFSLIILDPIYKLYGGTDENKAGDVARLMNAIEELGCATEAATAFGAHFSKGNQAAKESIDRISGSGVFARDPDSLLILTRHEQEHAFAVESVLRNFKPVDPFVVKWQYPLMVPDAALDPARLKQAGGRAKLHTPQTLLEVLGDQSLTTTEWQQQAEKEEGVKERTFFTLKKELQKLEKVLQSKINRKWQRIGKLD